MILDSIYARPCNDDTDGPISKTMIMLGMSHIAAVTATISVPRGLFPLHTAGLAHFCRSKRPLLESTLYPLYIHQGDSSIHIVILTGVR